MRDLQKLFQMLINKNGVKGNEAMDSTITKNHQDSPWELTTDVNL